VKDNNWHSHGSFSETVLVVKALQVILVTEIGVCPLDSSRGYRTSSSGVEVLTVVAVDPMSEVPALIVVESVTSPVDMVA